MIRMMVCYDIKYNSMLDCVPGSTAQGGGGSFKDSKLQEVDCCESCRQVVGKWLGAAQYSGSCSCKCSCSCGCDVIVVKVVAVVQ